MRKMTVQEITAITVPIYSAEMKFALMTGKNKSKIILRTVESLMAITCLK